MTLPVWSTDPVAAMRLQKAQEAMKIAREYGGTVDVIWATHTLNFNFPPETSKNDEFECIARVEHLMEETVH